MDVSTESKRLFQRLVFELPVPTIGGEVFERFVKGEDAKGAHFAGGALITNDESPPHDGRASSGRYWTRTSDLTDVNRAL